MSIGLIDCVPIETERLVLRTLQLEDAQFIYDLLHDPLWLQYIGDRGVHSLSDAQVYIEQRKQQSVAVCLKDHPDSPLGAAGLYRRDWLDEDDLGFAFFGRHCRNGFGTEIARAIIDVAKHRLNKQRLFAIVSPENQPCRGLLEKLGFQFQRETDGPTLVYQLNL